MSGQAKNEHTFSPPPMCLSATLFFHHLPFEFWLLFHLFPHFWFVAVVHMCNVGWVGYQAANMNTHNVFILSLTQV
jgi:hypothetical protein